MSGGGDTPISKHWKYAMDTPYYIAGRISEDEPDTLMAEIYSFVYNGETLDILFRDAGIAANLNKLSQEQLALVKTAIEAHFNIELTQIARTIGKIENMGDTLPDWDTYETV